MWQSISITIATENCKTGKLLHKHIYCFLLQQRQRSADLSVNLRQLLVGLLFYLQSQVQKLFPDWSHFAPHLHIYTQPTRAQLASYNSNSLWLWNQWRKRRRQLIYNRGKVAFNTDLSESPASEACASGREPNQTPIAPVSRTRPSFVGLLIPALATNSAAYLQTEICSCRCLQPETPSTAAFKPSYTWRGLLLLHLPLKTSVLQTCSPSVDTVGLMASTPVTSCVGTSNFDEDLTRQRYQILLLPPRFSEFLLPT